MKKKLIGIIAVIAIAIFAGYNVYTSQNKEVTLSDLALANVEALAQSEKTDCRTYPGGNTGVCKLKVDGSGAACVESSWYEANDCYR